MSLEFAVQHDCALRARYSEKHLREWGRLSSLHAVITTGDNTRPTEDKLKWIQEASAEIDRLQAESAICANCPACLPLESAGQGEAIGCLGRVNYPMKGEFEKFFANRVQLMLDTLDREDWPRLLHILIDPESPFDGETTKELRRVTTQNGLRFFELRLPIELTGAGAHLTTDNIFDLLAGFRSEDSDTTTYTRELPFEAAADYYDFLDLILRSELSQSEVARLTSRSRNYNQFLRLLTAIEKAERAVLARLESLRRLRMADRPWPADRGSLDRGAGDPALGAVDGVRPRLKDLGVLPDERVGGHERRVVGASHLLADRCDDMQGPAPLELRDLRLVEDGEIAVARHPRPTARRDGESRWDNCCRTENADANGSGFIHGELEQRCL